MFKQAIALLVDKNSLQVNSLIEQLESDFDVYIHIDKKSDMIPGDLVARNVWKKHKVYWGGYGMIQATVFLYKKILDTNISYTHIILLSGDSLPVKSNSYICDYLSANAGVSFIENIKADNIRLERRRLIWANEDFRKKTNWIKTLQNPFKVIRWFQKRLNIKRGTKGFERTGSQWTILARRHVQHLVDHCRFSEYRFMAVPDESVVQNHFTNHHLPYSSNLIYAHWPNQKSFSPHYIDDNTLLTLIESPYLFARKFEVLSIDSLKNTFIKNSIEEMPKMYNPLSLRFRSRSQSQ